MWELDFISEQDFKRHVQNTIQNYGEKLSPYDLKRFNSNIVDPIKLIFDKTVYQYSWDEIIKNEIFRQRDKSNNNDIGYFHQRIFQYMDGCTVPQVKWDIIFTKNSRIDIPECEPVKTIYVEMKNKHNTMNSASSSKTYMKMQGQLLSDDDCACFLVEAIAKKSQNITWSVSIDGAKQKHKMCMVLPSVIQEVIANADNITVPYDTVIEELQRIADAKNGSFVLALYMLGFKSYMGF